MQLPRTTEKKRRHSRQLEGGGRTPLHINIHQIKLNCNLFGSINLPFIEDGFQRIKIPQIYCAAHPNGEEICLFDRCLGDLKFRALDLLESVLAQTVILTIPGMTKVLIANWAAVKYLRTGIDPGVGMFRFGVITAVDHAEESLIT